MYEHEKCNFLIVQLRSISNYMTIVCSYTNNFSNNNIFLYNAFIYYLKLTHNLC